MKIAINESYGGFGLSREVIENLNKKGYKLPLGKEPCKDGSIPYSSRDENSYSVENEDFNIKSYDYNEYRNNKDLIEAIENSKNPSGKFADIVIIEISDNVNYEIEEYDGMETVHEVHKS